MLVTKGFIMLIPPGPRALSPSWKCTSIRNLAPIVPIYLMHNGQGHKFLVGSKQNTPSYHPSSGIEYLG